MYNIITDHICAQHYPHIFISINEQTIHHNILVYSFINAHITIAHINYVISLCNYETLNYISLLNHYSYIVSNFII